MFYDSQVMNSKSLKNAWRAGNEQELCSEDVPLPKICSLLDSWIASDYQDPCRRLALRTSSILVDGAARLYKQGLNDLIQDVYKMEYQMITRKRPRSFTDDEMDLSDSNSEQFEQSNDNETSPPGHSASPVTSDSSDVNKSGKPKKNNASISRGLSRSSNKKSRTISLEGPSGRATTNYENLPIGQIFVYEDPWSKVPSKIIVGNINPAVKNNIKF